MLLIVTASKVVFVMIPIVMMNFYWSILFAKVINSKAEDNENFDVNYSQNSASVKTTEGSFTKNEPIRF